MIKQTKKQSGFVIAAFITIGVLWIYCAVLYLFGHYFEDMVNGMQCARQDFGGCALQNLGAVGLYMVALLIFYVLAPVVIAVFSMILGIIGCFQRERKRILAVFCLIHNVLFLAAVAAVIVFY